jgi:hypothetical protein
MRKTLLGLCLVVACSTTARHLYDNTSVSGLAIAPLVTGSVVALHAGRIEHSTDAGQTWSVSPVFATLTAIVASGSAIYGLELGDGSASARTRVWHSVDSGTTFSATSALVAPVPATTSGALAVAATDSRRVVVAFGANPPTIEATRDSGTTWHVASVLSFSTGAYIKGAAFDRTNAQVAYVAHADGVFQSLDGGTSFAPLTTPFASSTVNGVAASGSAVFVATSAGLGVSSDRGATWTTRLIGRSSRVSAVTVDAQSASRIYVALVGEGIYGSTDGGTTFTLLVSSYTGPIVASGATVYVAGAHSGNSGLTWQPFGAFDFTAVQTAY